MNKFLTSLLAFVLITTLAIAAGTKEYGDYYFMDGDIGIGTSSPAQLLHMVGVGTAATGWARFGLSTTEYTEIGHRGSNSAINAVGDGDLDFRHDGVNKASLTDAGVFTATTFVGALTGTASGNLVSGGALGTPSGGTLTNTSGLPISGLVNSTATALGLGSINLGHASDTTIARSGAGAITVEGTAVLLSGGALGTPSGGSAANLTSFPTLNQNTTGSSGSCTGNAATVTGFTRASGSLTLAGADAVTITTTAGTNVTFPTTGTLVNSAVATLSSLTSIGTIGTGTWAATDVAIAHGGTGASTLAGASIPTYTSTNTFTNKRITKRVVTTASDATAVIDIDTTDTYELTAMAAATTFTLTGTPTDGQMLMVRFKDNGTTRALTWTGFTALGITLPTDSTAGKWHYVGCTYNLGGTAWHCIAEGEQA